MQFTIAEKQEKGAPTVSAGDNSRMAIKKADAAEQLVYGEAYAPGFPDSDGDFMTAETVRKMAFDFLRKGTVGKIDTDHLRLPTGIEVVESFIAREDDPTFIPQSWVLGVKCPDEVWDRVVKGELNAFSIDGDGWRSDSVIEMTIPEKIEGETEPGPDGKTHRFWVKYDEDGNFLGGETYPDDSGHIHLIRRGTLTESSEGHEHRFAFVEGLLRAQV